MSGRKIFQSVGGVSFTGIHSSQASSSASGSSNSGEPTAYTSEGSTANKKPRKRSSSTPPPGNCRFYPSTTDSTSSDPSRPSEMDRLSRCARQGRSPASLPSSVESGPMMLEQLAVPVVIRNYDRILALESVSPASRLKQIKILNQFRGYFSEITLNRPTEPSNVADLIVHPDTIMTRQVAIYSSPESRSSLHSECEVADPGPSPPIAQESASAKVLKTPYRRDPPSSDPAKVIKTSQGQGLGRNAPSDGQGKTKDNPDQGLKTDGADLIHLGSETEDQNKQGREMWTKEVDLIDLGSESEDENVEDVLYLLATSDEDMGESNQGIQDTAAAKPTVSGAASGRVGGDAKASKVPSPSVEAGGTSHGSMEEVCGGAAGLDGLLVPTEEKRSMAQVAGNKENINPVTLPKKHGGGGIRFAPQPKPNPVDILRLRVDRVSALANFYRRMGHRLMPVGEDVDSNSMPTLFAAGWSNMRELAETACDTFTVKKKWDVIRLRNPEYASIRSTIRAWREQICRHQPRPGDAVILDAVTRASWRGGEGNHHRGFHSREVVEQGDAALGYVIEELQRLVNIINARVRIIVLGPLLRYPGMSCCERPDHADALGANERSMINLGHLHSIDGKLRRSLARYHNVAVVGSNDLAGTALSRSGRTLEFYRRVIRPDGVHFCRAFREHLTTIATDWTEFS